MPHVYIIRSKKSGKYYTGCSKNITTRLLEHNRGKVFSTKTDRPWELIYSETCSNLKEARKREKQIKKWKSRMAIERLFKSLNLTKSRILDSNFNRVGKGTAKNMGITIE